jgi:hypothetical protein
MGTKKITVDDLIRRTLPENISEEIERVREIEAKKRKKGKLTPFPKRKNRGATS